ncbi:MAG TPA: PPOX class F420-dependent oxidoreductase [Actinomycetota bacterium]
MPFEALDGRFGLLTTHRRDGTAVATPMWVVVVDGNAYAASRAPGKVKRIRRNPNVEIAPCTMRGTPLGPSEPGVARVVTDAMPAAVRRAFRRKFGPLPALGRVAYRLRRKPLVLLEISARSKVQASGL